MIVDGRKFKIYFLDSKTSIEERISSIKNILPQYLLFEYGEDEETIKTTNIFDLVGEYKTFTKFYSENKKKFSLDLPTFAKIWYSYLLLEKELDRDTLDKELQKEDYSINRLEREYKEFDRENNEKMEMLKNRVQELITKSNVIDTVGEKYSTEIELLKIKTEINFTVDYDIYELFNNIKLDVNNPFVSIGNYYKVLKDFIPSLKWTNYRDRILSDFGTEKDVLYLKVLNVKNTTDKKVDESKYSTVSVVFKKEKNKNRVFLRVESSINSDLSEDKLLERILYLFQDFKEVDEKKQIQVKGEFLIPQFYLEKYIFLEVLSSDDIVSKICSVDERFKVSKSKGSIYIYFNTDTQNEDSTVTASLLNKLVEKTSLKIISKDEKLKVDTPYLRVLVTKAKNMNEMQEFKRKFLKILSYCEKKRTSIIKRYEKYIPDFLDTMDREREEEETKKKKSFRQREMLKDIDPDQFISGYSRWLCPTKRAPRIVGGVDDSEIANKIEEDGYQTMLFPKNSIEDGKEYKQYYYSCNHHSKDIYPGLRINKLSNFEKYPIVPCCYRKDHTTKKRSVWRKYYEENKGFNDFKTQIEGLKDEDDKHIYKTNKILPLKRYGILVDNIREYFYTIDSKHTFLRQGVSRSFSSVIESLLSSLDPDFDGYTDKEITTIVHEKRREMVSLLDKVGYQQESFLYTRETMEKYILDFDKYLDPKITIKLLENLFKCKIFIFSQNEENPQGTIECPLHYGDYLYYDFNSSLPVVFIYEHTGSELDMAQYPQCELIVRINSEGVKEYSIDKKSIVVRRTIEVFREIFGDRCKKIHFKNVVSQEVDFYGKTRKLYFSNGVYCLTSPIAPLDVKIGIVEVEQSDDEVYKFIEEEGGIKIVSRVVFEGFLYGIECKKEGITLYFPIKKKNVSESNTQIVFPIGSYSQLKYFTEYSKIARYLYEYTKYLFSLNYNGEKIDLDFIKRFIDEYILIDRNHVYKYTKREFSLRSPLLRDGKLIVKDEKIKDRLLYYLRLKIRDDEKGIIDYKNNKYMSNYYVSISDFEHLDSQPILQGTTSLLKWIQNYKNIYTLRDSVSHIQKSISLLIEGLNKKLPFCLVFHAKWNKQSRNLLSYIYTKGKDRLYNTYKDRINFVYVDIEDNKSLVSSFSIEEIPTCVFCSFETVSFKEISRVIIKEKIEVLEEEIIKLLNISL